MDREIQQRLQWVKMYEECGDAGLVCRRCGISRPTLRKWALSVGVEELDLLLAEWQHYYNWERSYSSLNGVTPIDRIIEISDQTPLSEEESLHYQFKKERFQEQNYKLDLS